MGVHAHAQARTRAQISRLSMYARARAPLQCAGREKMLNRKGLREFVVHHSSKLHRSPGIRRASASSDGDPPGI
eukprot:3222621-Pleurochrysis_carterae.AAC.1